MTDLGRQVLEAITANPGQKAKDIASVLGVDRNLVNSALYGSLKGKVRQDKTYRWYPNGVAKGTTPNGAEPKQLNTPLARLCRYYLECISHDDLGGVSEFATSIYGDPKYVELATFPGLDINNIDPFGSESARHLLRSVRRDRNRQTIFVGYPVRLRFIRARSGWEGFRVEPLLLFPCQEVRDPSASPRLTEEQPYMNYKALQGLTNTSDANLIYEAIELSEALGLGNALGDQPELDELFSRLQAIHPEWDWQEEIDPYAIGTGFPLSELNVQGIYNRAILIAAERSPYTKGLEFELQSLQTVDETKYRGTALGTWISNQLLESTPPSCEPLIEVLPLNSEQRDAVQRALSNEFTVITGPPGTGKSQVVTSILVNAAREGKKVLFASKNNKAVDVVETRVNSLGPRPVLLRLGMSQYQSRLAEYVVSLLATTATANDHELFRGYESFHAELRRRSEAINAELAALVELRNRVDHLDRQVESIREEIGADSFRRIGEGNLDSLNLKQKAALLQGAIDDACKAIQPALSRLVWPLISKNRFQRLKEAGTSFRDIAAQIGLPTPDIAADLSLEISEWIQYKARLEIRVSQAMAVLEYFTNLRLLTKARSLEELSALRNQLINELCENSNRLWQAWLRLQPSRLDPEQRRVLGDYSALLQMIVSANNQNQQLGREVLRRYYQLFPKIASMLPCWAVTSLSARGGRVPFEPGFFDLLVIDEASQCDIASALPLLYRARRVVVIGDPMQLRHISSLSKHQDQQLLSKHDLIDEYPGWAYSVRSLFDLASSLCRSEDIVALRDHHRSHADIIGFSNEEFYEGRLRIATNYDRLNSPRREEPAVRWVDIHGHTVRPSVGGALNEAEALAVVNEIQRLFDQGYRGTIGVVSPFRAQANRIRNLVHDYDNLGVSLVNADFLVDTVHKFQGDERDVIIFSPVVSSGSSEGAYSFLRNNQNLFNVAVTRARSALIVVGDKAHCLNCNVPYLARFANHVDRVANREEAKNPVMASCFGDKYPVVANPERVSEWERLFYAELYRNGVRTIPQYAVEQYLLDLAVLDGERRLDIEIDGERYHRNWDGELCRRDQIRNQRLMELGWDVMRFWVYQIRDNQAGCVARVKEWIDQPGKSNTL